MPEPPASTAPVSTGAVDGRPLATVGALIEDPQGRILLIRTSKWRGRLGLPGGKIERGETQEQALRRELHEETGLEVRPLQLVDVFYRPAGAYDRAHALVAVVYLCEVTGGTITPSHETPEVRYWPIDAVTNWHANHRQYAVRAREAWEALTR